MAKADYRCCDLCDSKVFYDANLNYEPTKTPPFFKLDYLGDWAVICEECAKTHECKIVPRSTSVTVNSPLSESVK